MQLADEQLPRKPTEAIVAFCMRLVAPDADHLIGSHIRLVESSRLVCAQLLRKFYRGQGRMRLRERRNA
jgi:hypothetical protein